VLREESNKSKQGHYTIRQLENVRQQQRLCDSKRASSPLFESDDDKTVQSKWAIIKIKVFIIKRERVLKIK
jgi:hypothetical protein